MNTEQQIQISDILVIDNLSDIIEYIDMSKPLAFDIETYNFTTDIRVAQFAQHEPFNVNGIKYKAILVRKPEMMPLIEILTNAETVIIHNAAYEGSQIQDKLGKISVFKNVNFYDTMLAAKLAFPQLDNFRFETLVTFLLDENPYKENGIDKKLITKNNLWDLEDEDERLYCAYDVIYLINAYDACESKLKDSKLNKLVHIFAKHCLDFQNNGIPVLNDKLTERYNSNNKTIAGLNLTFNAGSWQQIQKALGVNSKTGDEVLASLVFGCHPDFELDKEKIELAKKIRISKSLTKNNTFITTYFREQIECDDGVPRVYSHFYPNTVPGRTTSKDINLQQIPRSLLGMFGFKETDGKVLVYSDFSQLHLRCATAIVGIKKLANALYNGDDIHAITTRGMVGRQDFTDEERTFGKTANFSFLYGGGAEVFRLKLLSTLSINKSNQECNEIKRAWMNTWPEIAAWHKQAWSDQKRNIMCRTPIGRKFYPKTQQERLNLPIQGFDAEIEAMTMNLLYKNIQDFKGVKMINLIHDAFLFECPNDEQTYMQFSEFLADCMIKAWKQLSINCTIKDIPMPVDVKVGYNWGLIGKENIYTLQKS